MDINKLKNAGIDYESGLNRFLGDKGLYEKYLKAFLQDSNFSQAGKALEIKDYDNAMLHLHSLKGLTGNLSMLLLYDCCAKAIAELRACNYDILPENYAMVSIEYEKVCLAVSESDCVL